MNITRRPDVAAELMDEMRRSFGDSARPDVHLSDTLNPRYAFWARVAPKLASDDEIVYFLSGRGYEDVYGRLAGLERGRADRAFGITYTVDFYRGTFAELKTRRRDLAPEGQEFVKYSHYIEQCKGYCAIVRGKLIESGQRENLERWNRCELFVFTTAQKQPDGSTKPAFMAYEIEFTDLELDDHLIELRQRAGTLESLLIQAQDPTGSRRYKSTEDLQALSRFLPLCWDWKCGTRSSEMVKKPYCTTCEREFKTDWGIDKHVSSKTGKGHTVTKAEYRFFYLPRCKHYQDCKPYLDDPTRGGEAVGESPTHEDGTE